jgi:biopolymer transport protein TolQ
LEFKVEQEISIIGLIADASFIVQLVMFSLFLASVVSWYFIFQRSTFFKSAKREQLVFEERFWSGMDLNQLFKDANHGQSRAGLELIFKAGF